MGSADWRAGLQRPSAATSRAWRAARDPPAPAVLTGSRSGAARPRAARATPWPAGRRAWRGLSPPPLASRPAMPRAEVGSPAQCRVRRTQATAPCAQPKKRRSPTGPPPGRPCGRRGPPRPRRQARRQPAHAPAAGRRRKDAATAPRAPRPGPRARPPPLPAATCPRRLQVARRWRSTPRARQGRAAAPRASAPQAAAAAMGRTCARQSSGRTRRCGCDALCACCRAPWLPAPPCGHL